MNQMMPEDWNARDTGRLAYKGYQKMDRMIPEDKKFNPEILF